jgi:outer membrane protein assembly factor BamB
MLVALGSTAVKAEGPTGVDEWPQWRGPDRTGQSRAVGLLKEWPEGGPTVAWQVDTVGVGYSSMAVKDGRLITLGDLDGVEHIIALSVKDGSTLWAVQPEPVAQQLMEQVAGELKKLDKNSDGTVDEAEALAGIGPKYNDFTKPVEGDKSQIAGDRAARLLKQLDIDGDGKLNYAEAGSRFRDTYSKVDAAEPNANNVIVAAERAAPLFKELDKDGDGKISKNEARGSALIQPFDRIDQRLPGTQQGDGQLTAEEVEAYFVKSEPGRDGVITLAELTAYNLQNYPNKTGALSTDELRSYYGGYRNGMGDGPRSTPTIDGSRVYVEGGNGDLACLDAETGRTIWHLNLVKDFGGGRPGWGYCESPLVEGNLLIVTPGGSKGTVVALDKLTGKVIWRSEGVHEGAHYSSPIAASIGGVREVVQFAAKNVFGLNAADGKLLWSYGKANNGTANCATPVVLDNHVFASSAYGTGGGLAKISGQGTDQKAEEVYFEKKMANHHGGLVLVGDHMYGFNDGALIAMNYLTGKIAWMSRSVGKGSLVYADGMLYCLGEKSEVGLVEAYPNEYRERGRFKIDNFGRPSWAHPIVTGGRLYIRNMHRLTAYDVTDKGA